VRAIALFSGGLDSTLAVKVVRDQGVDVTALYVNIGFGSTKDRREHMESMCRQVGADFLEVDIRNQFVRDILFSPKYGYGKNFNPCIDCHGNMFRVAKGMMAELGASFLISGEVVGQRPMSQNMRAMESVLGLAEDEGLLLRPLSAKMLPLTTPEKEGWIDREKLYGINGRGRHKQLQLAKEFGLKDFDTPAGGCLLTEPYFAVKMRDFIEYDSFEVSDIDVLKHGRHFRLPDGAKLVIGRNSEDNSHIEAVESQKYQLLQLNGVVGPVSLLSADSTDSDLQIAMRGILSYTKAEPQKEYSFIWKDSELTAIAPSSRTEVQGYALK
jgi:tRNA-specific 2-thiouridylase